MGLCDSLSIEAGGQVQPEQVITAGHGVARVKCQRLFKACDRCGDSRRVLVQDPQAVPTNDVRWVDLQSVAQCRFGICCLTRQRMPLVRPVRVLDGDSDLGTACCRDISPAGIGLLHFAPIVNERAVVTIEIREVQLTLPAKLQWHRTHRDEVFSSGWQLDASVHDQVSQVMEHILWKDRERRLHDRFPFFREVLIRQDASASLHGFTVDICEGGMGLISEEPLEPGAMVHIDVNDSNDAACTVSVQIRWCQPCGQRLYRAGGQMLQDATDPLAVGDRSDLLVEAGDTQ